MNSPEIKAFIRQNSDLFWYIPEEKKEDISLDVLVEFILNFGDMDTVKEMIRIIGIQQVAYHFFHATKLSKRRKSNFNELTLNYFTLLFNKYAPSYTNRKPG
ncbi:MAG: hypothetical protein JXR52_09125 [Bacteroidales bacterium]|nr:hypothetical protein [Bacteroidales bacterium]